MVNSLILVVLAVSVANNKKDIIRDWEWIETNLMQTLGML